MQYTFSAYPRSATSQFFSVPSFMSLCCSPYEKKDLLQYRKAIKAVSGFLNYFQCSKVTKSATKRCVCAPCAHVCAHAGLLNCTAKLLRPKEELLKPLLTSVSSADHHLVPAPRLPSYRIVVCPHLTEGSKRCSVRSAYFRENTSTTSTEVLCNDLPAKLIPVIFCN